MGISLAYRAPTTSCGLSDVEQWTGIGKKIGGTMAGFYPVEDGLPLRIIMETELTY